MRRMIQTPFLTVLGFCLAGAPLVAQSLDNGQIHGAVRDASGVIVPGARLILSSPNMQGTRTIATNDRGEYMAPLLLPGVYRIVVTCPGYVGCTVENIRVGAGAAIRQDMTIKATQAAGATVVVVDSAVEVDKADTKTSVDFDSENLLRMTGGRTLDKAMTLVAGVNPGTVQGQYSIRGGTGNNTQMTLNGVPIADPLQGQVTGDYYIEDNVEDVAVVLSPANARFGRMLGGGVNVVTKSGTNEFSGSIRQNMSRSSWRGRQYQDDWYDSTSRTGGMVADAISRDTFITLSGPVLKDKLWFSYGTHLKPSSSTSNTLPVYRADYLGPQRTGNPTTVDALTAVNPDTGQLVNPIPQLAGYSFAKFDSGKPYADGNIYKYHEGKITWALNENHRFQVYGSHAVSGDTMSTDGGKLFLSQLTQETGTNQQWGISYDGILGAATFVEFKASRNKSWANYAQGDTSRDPQNNPVVLWTDAFQGAHQYQALTNIAGSGLGAADEERNQGNISLNVKLLRNWGSVQHDIDLGGAYFQGDIHSEAYYGGALAAFRVGGMYVNGAGDWLFPTVDWSGQGKNGQSGSGLTGLAPTMVKCFGNDGKNGYEVNRNRALYVNDQMTLSPKWNLMVGLRVDANDMIDGTLNKKILPTTWGISPRLVATYDINGDSSRVVKVSFLRLQSDYPTSLTNALFTKADSQVVRYGWSPAGQPAINTPNDLVGGVPMYGVRFVPYSEIINQSNYGIPFYFSDQTRNFIVDPNIKPQGNNELSIEYRRTFAPGSYFRTSFVHRQFDHIIAFSQDYYSDVWKANPNAGQPGQPAYIPGPMNQWAVLDDFTGHGLRQQDSQITRVFNSSELNREYNGFEVEAANRINAIFSWRFTYTYSRTAGNSDAGELNGSPFVQGIGLSAQDGFNNANFLRTAMGRDLASTSPNGSLLVDRPHQANLTLMAVLPVGKGWVSYSLVGTYVSGANWTATMAAPFEDSLNNLSGSLAAYATANPNTPAPVALGGATWNQYYSARGAYHQNDQYNVDLNIGFEIPIAAGVKAFGNLAIVNVFNHMYQQSYDTTIYNGANYGGLTQLYLDTSRFGSTHGVRAGGDPEQDHYTFFDGPRQATVSLGLKF